MPHLWGKADGHSARTKSSTSLLFIYNFFNWNKINHASGKKPSCFYTFYLLQYLIFYLERKLNLAQTKKLFFLIFFEYISKNINFEDFILTSNYPGYELNNFYQDIENKDNSFADIFLELDRIDIENIKNLNKTTILTLENKLLEYYNNSFTYNYQIRPDKLNKFNHHLST